MGIVVSIAGIICVAATAYMWFAVVRMLVKGFAWEVAKAVKKLR